jgi:hypothetical protein
MKGEKRSPKRRSLFFNAADMQLASQLRLLTRLSSPSGNSPTLCVLRITQRMTWPTHALAVLSVLQGRGRAGAQGRAGRPDRGQGRVRLSVCLAGQGAGQGGQGRGQIKLIKLHTGRRSWAPMGDFTVAFDHGHPLVCIKGPLLLIYGQ